ncbi:MAG: LamG domain-containing protein [Pirellulales bacterium]
MPASAVNLNTDASLIVWYKLNGTTTSAVNSAPGGGHAGTLTGGPPTYLPVGSQKVGGGVAFDRDNSDRIVVADAAALTPARLTVAFWFNASDWTNDLTTLASKYGASPFPGWAIRWRTTGTKIEAFMRSDAYGFADSGSFTATEAWHHLAITYSGTTPGDTSFRLYLDGAMVDSDVTPETNLPDNATDLWIGGDGFDSGGRYFDGKIADFRLYSRTLSDAEITRLYNMRLQPARTMNHSRNGG